MHNHTSDYIIDVNLYPALVQVFVIIIIGYFSAYFNILNQTHANGLNIFLSRFSLPALIFQSLCRIRFESVKWPFLLAILCAKSTIFFLLFVICFVVVKPLNLGLCGIYAIFVSQSNDFALGDPLIKSLYSAEYVDYIYLIAPISLCILNPIGFLMLEINYNLNLRSSNGNNGNGSTWSLIVNIVFGTFKNPIVIMTILGIIFNFIFQQRIPYLFESLIKSLANAFNSIALFYLGYMMYINQNKINNYVVLILLILTKSLIFPLITCFIVYFMDIDAKYDNTTQFNTFSFLWGTFPTAPSIYFYLNKYTNVGESVLSTALVFGTFSSVPLIILSTNFIKFDLNHRVLNTTDASFDPHSILLFYENILCNTSKYTSIVTILCLTWLLYTFISAHLSSLHTIQRPRKFISLSRNKSDFNNESTTPDTAVVFNAETSINEPILYIIVNQLATCVIELAWFYILNIKHFYLRLVYFLFITFFKFQFLLLLVNLILQFKVFLVKIGLFVLVPFLFTFLFVLFEFIPSGGGDGGLQEVNRFLYSSNTTMIYKLNSIQNVVFILSLFAVLVCLCGCLFRYYMTSLNSKRDSVIPLIGDDEEDGDEDDDDNEGILRQNTRLLGTQDECCRVQGARSRQMLLTTLLTISLIVALFFHIYDLVDVNHTSIYYEVHLIHLTFFYGQGMFVFMLYGFKSDLYIIPVLKSLKLLFHHLIVKLKQSTASTASPVTLKRESSNLSHRGRFDDTNEVIETTQ